MCLVFFSYIGFYVLFVCGFLCFLWVGCCCCCSFRFVFVLVVVFLWGGGSKVVNVDVLVFFSEGNGGGVVCFFFHKIEFMFFCVFAIFLFLYCVAFI